MMTKRYVVVLLLSSFLLATNSSGGALAFQQPPLPSSSNSNGRSHHHQTMTVKSVVGGASSSSSSFPSCIRIDETAPRDVATMEEWATACGVQTSEGFQLTTVVGVGLAEAESGEETRDVNVGVLTNQAIPAGDPVLFVPADMILTGAKARQEFLFGTDANDNPATTTTTTIKGEDDILEETDQLPQFYLFLKILQEYELGDQSAWYYWLNSLPRYFSNGSAMTHFCCTQCLPPFVGALANQERLRFLDFFRALQQPSGWTAANNNNNNLLSAETRSNRQLAKWAFSVVYTRSFPIHNNNNNNSGDVQIAPMADMFNHGTQAEVELHTDDEGNCYGYAAYDIPAGSPLRLSYGDPTNPSHLFARYGFLDETAPATFCKIMISNPSSELLDMGYDQSRMLFYKDTGDVSQEVWDVLLYQILESSPEQQQALYVAHTTGDATTKQALHEQFYTHTSRALYNHIDDFVQQLDRLYIKAIGRDVNDHPRLPLIMKHNEFVKETFLIVRARLQME